MKIKDEEAQKDEDDGALMSEILEELFMPFDKLIEKRQQENLKPFVPEDNFEKDLYSAFQEKLKDEGFAVSLYAALNNNNWKNMKTGEIIKGMTFRGNAGLIASMRAQGESYLDFYCKNHNYEGTYIPDGFVSDEIKEVLGVKYGWVAIDMDMEDEEEKKDE